MIRGQIDLVRDATGYFFPIAISCLLATVLLSSGAIAQARSSTGAALYDVDHLNAYTASIRWQMVRKEGNTTTVCRGEGSAIFLGGGLFLTAAHVVDQNPSSNECADAGMTDPVVEFGSTELPGKTLAIQPWDEEDGLAYPEGMDLALVEVDSRMMQPELRTEAPHRLCESNLTEEGVEIAVSTKYGTYAAKTQPSTGGLYSRIDFPGKPGDSGGGVFDKTRFCLLGIISSGGFQGSNYVATGVVRRFLDRFEAEPSTDVHFGRSLGQGPAAKPVAGGDDDTTKTAQH
jgi:Trypsin-like peptidase domain